MHRLIQRLKGAPKLCFVKQSFAFFTSLPVEKQTGEGWNNVDFQFFAEPPQSMGEVEIVMIAFEGARVVPDGLQNTPLMINASKLPWLITGSGATILAGTALIDFLNHPELTVYIPKKLLF